MSDALSELADVLVLASAPAQIADHIMSSIAVGALPPGSALPPERELAETMQVSRSSVRAALGRLERGGFIVRRRGRGGGTFIADSTEQVLPVVAERVEEFHRARYDLLDARAVLQNRIAHQAALRRTEEQLRELRALVAEYALQPDAAAARLADARLHHAMAQAGGNPEIARMAVELDRRINLGFRHDPFSAELFARACSDHAAIVRAIAEQDAQTAAQLCEDHFRATSIPAARRTAGDLSADTGAPAPRGWDSASTRPEAPEGAC